MSDTSGYDPAAGGIANLFRGDTVGNPDLAQAYLNKHRGAVAQRQGQIDQVMGDQKANIDQMSRLLDETTAALKASREGRSNLPLMALGAGMLSSPGNFGQQVGAGVRMMIPTIAADRQDEEDYQGKLSDIAMKKTTIANAPLETQLSYLKALQVGDIAAMRAIEQAQVRTAGGAGGQDPAIVKEYRAWKSAPGNEDKTLQDYQEWKSRLGSDRNTPALLRELAAVNKARAEKGEPPLSLIDYQRQKAAAGASGKAEGTSQTEAFEGIPSLVNNAEIMQKSIDQVLAHPGLPKAVGLTSILPDIPGGESADFNAQLDKLKGQAFLTMFGQLRGGGAITEVEGKKATDALAALSTRQSPEQFKKNLKEVNEILAKGISVARQKARLETPKTDVPAAPGTTAAPAPVPQGVVKEGTLAKPKGGKGPTLIRRNGEWVEFNGSP